MTVAPRPSRTGGRRLAVVLAAAALALVAAPGAATPANADTRSCATPDFLDVARTSSFYTATTWLRCEEISTGYADGTYRPSRQITRGELALLVYRHSGETHRPGTAQDFSDVPLSSGPFTAISWLLEKGYTTGYRDGTFRPAQAITRQELAAFMYRIAGEPELQPPAGWEPFSDVRSPTYAPAANWLKSTGIITGYSDGTFRPERLVTRGEAAKFLYALQAHLHGIPPTYRVPVRSAASGSTANATGGAGGPLTDARAIPYTNGTSSSTYNLYADHLEGRRPHGILFHLHGDGALEYREPQWTTIPAYERIAEEHDLLLVVPRTPDTTGSITWWEGEASARYAADLFTHLGTRYDLDLDRVYLTGYSGGAEAITYKFMDAYSDRFTGGAAVIVGGGGASTWRQPTRPLAAVLKDDFPMHWVVGADDTPARGGASGSFDAVKAARTGEAHYRGLGMRTSLTIEPGMDHWEIAPSGPATLARVLADR